jgi:hypothetical protein
MCKISFRSSTRDRIKHRWEAMDKENQAILQSKSQNRNTYSPDFSQWNTVKLLARNRYILYKSREKWTINHEERARILFELYPDILSQQFYKWIIYQSTATHVEPDPS